MLNFLNRLVHCPFLELSITEFVENKVRSWSANSVELGQTLVMCKLALLYTGGKGLSLLVPAL